ncbi:MAG: hypothetical protein ACM31C_28645 [Acidobacteriota bacterium]
MAIGLALGVVPLFGVLGYELALGASLFAAACGLDLGAALARALQALPAAGISRAAYPGRSLARSAATASAMAVIVTLLPAIVCAVRGIWVPTCDWWFGIEAYALIPLVTAALAGPVGHAVGVVVGVRAHDRWWPHRSSVLAQLVWLPLAAAALWRFYSQPPVFVFSPVIGYFPGNLYDENVRLGSALVWERLEAVLGTIAIVAGVAVWLDVPRFRVTRAPRPASRRIAPAVVSVLALAGALALHAMGGTLGYAIDEDDIVANLDGTIETPHFVIHYAKSPAIMADLPLIVADHEFRYAEVVAELGDAPAGKLTSFYFATADDKARWLGPRNVEMAKPWRREIYLDHRPFPHPSLRHEIAHAVASAFGDPIFGIAVRDGVLVDPGLVEGLAVAADWPGSGTLTPHEAVRAMQVLGVQPSLGQLFSLGFLAQSSTRGYATAGSFVRFLFDRYGAAKLRALYRSGNDFAGVYDKPLSELAHEWRDVIAQITLPSDVIEGTRERFRVKSVFQRPCPHAVAARREAAEDAAAFGDREHAIQLMRAVCSDAPDEPAYRLALADYLYIDGGAERGEAITLWSALAADPEHVTSSVRAWALERLALAAAARGDVSIVKQLIDQAAALPLEGSQRRKVEAELYTLDHEGPAAPALYGYFFAPAGTFKEPQWAELAVLGEPHLGFAHYLLGLQRFSAGNYTDATAELTRAIHDGLPNLHFVEFASRQLAIAGYRTHDRLAVTLAIASLEAPGMSEVDRLLAEDWSHRLAFDASGHL